MSNANVPAASDATTTQTPGAAPVAEAAAPTPVVEAPAIPVASGETTDSAPEQVAGDLGTTAAPTQPAEATEPVVSTSETTTESSIEQAPQQIPTRQAVFKFTEVHIVSELSHALAASLTPKGQEVDPTRHWFIADDATNASIQINSWASGNSPLTLFGSMDRNGSLKRPFVLGTDMGRTSIAIIHLTGEIVHIYDQNNQLIGEPQMRALDTFQPPAPPPAQPQPPVAEAAQ